MYRTVKEWDGEPLPERMTFRDALGRVRGNVSWAMTALRNGTASEWNLGTVEGTDLAEWRLYGSGKRVPLHPGGETHYPNGYISEWSEGEGRVPAVDPSHVPDPPEGLHDGRAWWDAVHGWIQENGTGWNAAWGDASSRDALRDAPGPVVSLYGSENEAGFAGGRLVPPDPECGDGRLVQWGVEVLEDGGIRTYAFQDGVFHPLDWREGDGEEVPWHDSADVDWPPDLCLHYGATSGTRGPTWTASHLSGDVVVSWSFDGRTGEPL